VARRLELSAGGRKVPLNKFTRLIITDTLLGLLKNLKDLDSREEIVLRLGSARSARGEGEEFPAGNGSPER
jgi:hypothetical protein